MKRPTIVMASHCVAHALFAVVIESSYVAAIGKRTNSLFQITVPIETTVTFKPDGK